MIKKRKRKQKQTVEHSYCRCPVHARVHRVEAMKCY